MGRITYGAEGPYGGIIINGGAGLCMGEGRHEAQHGKKRKDSQDGWRAGAVPGRLACAQGLRHLRRHGHRPDGLRVRAVGRRGGGIHHGAFVVLPGERAGPPQLLRGVPDRRDAQAPAHLRPAPGYAGAD